MATSYCFSIWILLPIYHTVTLGQSMMEFSSGTYDSSASVNESHLNQSSDSIIYSIEANRSVVSANDYLESSISERSRIPISATEIMHSSDIPQTALLDSLEPTSALISPSDTNTIALETSVNLSYIYNLPTFTDERNNTSVHDSTNGIVPSHDFTLSNTSIASTKPLSVLGSILVSPTSSHIHSPMHISSLAVNISTHKSTSPVAIGNLSDISSASQSQSFLLNTTMLSPLQDVANTFISPVMSSTFVLSNSVMQSYDYSESSERSSSYFSVITPSKTLDILTSSATRSHISIPELDRITYSIYRFVFEGNCSLVKSSDQLANAFYTEVQNTLASELGISKYRLSCDNIFCGSIILNITIADTVNTKIDEQIMEIIASGNFSFSINDTNKRLHFQAAGVKVVQSPAFKHSNPAHKGPEREAEEDDSLFRGFWELSETERILIIVFSVLGGFLFILALAYIVHVCCMQGHSKSFDLGESPDLEVKMEDFTLTKLQRPPTIYDEHGMILTEDLNPGQTKLAVPYIPNHNHNLQHYSQATACPRARDSPHIVRRPNHAEIHGSAENLVTHHQLRRDRDGIDNMSFSSDDVLGDGGSSEEEDEAPVRHKPGEKI